MFERSTYLIAKDNLDQIQNSHILLVGLGGVGGMCFEALIRLGFKHFTIVDSDIFEKSNLNRQILSLNTTLNQKKVDIAKKRALDINPEVKINAQNVFLTKDNLENTLTDKYDFIIDACDTITTKANLIKYAQIHKTKIISCLGTGNRYNPNLIEITTLAKTHNDPLAKALRNILRKENINLDIPVVWSGELPVKIKENVVGSLMLVPATAGIYLAYYVLNSILEK